MIFGEAAQLIIPRLSVATIDDTELRPPFPRRLRRMDRPASGTLAWDRRCQMGTLAHRLHLAHDVGVDRQVGICSRADPAHVERATVSQMPNWLCSNYLRARSDRRLIELVETRAASSLPLSPGTSPAAGDRGRGAPRDRLRQRMGAGRWGRCSTTTILRLAHVELTTAATNPLADAADAARMFAIPFDQWGCR